MKRDSISAGAGVSMDGQEERAKWLRRVVLTVMVAAAASALPGPVQAFECPPGDRTDWYLDPTARRVEPSQPITWIVLSYEALQRQCDGWRYANGAEGCTWVWADPLVPGANYAVVYATMSREDSPERLVEHEECHALGWMHGRHVEFPVWPRFAR